MRAEREEEGARVGRAEGEAGPAQGKGEGAGPASGRAGPRELGCWRLGFGLVSLFFLPLFFSKQHSNLFVFKSNLNPNSYALKRLKLMHQHECTNKLALK